LKGQKLLWLGSLAHETSPHSVHSLRRAGEHFVAQLDGIEDRDSALALGRPEVWVSRAQFPVSRTDEFYWVDLVGCTVINRQGERMGTVVSLDDHGAHALLGVSADEGNPFLIPFVDAYIDRVDLAIRTIFVDWQADYV
jgi:16S rRNA processing protein RimM